MYNYFDSFNRNVATLRRNFQNNNYYWDQRQRFNARGHKIWELLPYNSNGINGGLRYNYFDSYDSLGRLTKKRTSQANDTFMTTTYTYNGLETSIKAVSTGLGAKTLNMSRKYNGLQQLVWTRDADKSVDPLGNKTSYAYDGAGNPISIQDSLGNKITTRFNALGQKEWVHDPNAGNKTFQYNSLGELEREVDANGDVLTYRYDSLGRMDRRWTNGVYSGIWSYDNPNTWGRKGMLDYEYNTTTTTDRLTKYYRYAKTAGGKDFLSYNVHYIYENGGLPASNKHVTYFYMDNNYGRPKGMKYGTTGVTIAYDYTSLGYLQTIKNAASGYVYRQITDQDARGNAVGARFGNSVLSQGQRFHPATGQMQCNRVLSGNVTIDCTETTPSNVIHNLEYDYGAFSNLYQSIVTASNGQENYETYTYDNLHRLTKSVRAFSNGSPNHVVNTAYNAIGNITSKSDYGNTFHYGNVNKSAGGNAGPNAIRSLAKAGGGSTTYSYDNNGNLKSGDGRTLVYNVFNKPLTITKGSVTTKFSYGADLMRYKQYKYNIPGGPQTTYYIDKHFEVEKQGSRTTYRHYIDGVAILNKTVDGSTSWKLGFNFKDHLGSVVTVADQNGDVIEHRSFDPFGKPRKGDFTNAAQATITSAVSGDAHTDRGFTDHEHLDEMQLIHMNGRVYDYNIGRFTSVDPFIQGTGSQAMNPYSYIQNNPLSGTDPSGYMACEASERKNACDKNDGKFSGGGGHVYQATGQDDNGNEVTVTVRTKNASDDISNESLENVEDISITSDSERTYLAVNSGGTSAVRNGSQVNYGNVSIDWGEYASNSDVRNSIDESLYSLSTNLDDYGDIGNLGTLVSDWRFYSDAVDSSPFAPLRQALEHPSSVILIFAIRRQSAPRGLGWQNSLFKSAVTNYYKNSGFTNAGRALLKHPNIAGLYPSKGAELKALLTAFRSKAGINNAAAQQLKYIMRNGTASTKNTKAFGRVIDYKLDNGMGARFSSDTNSFITFLGRGL